MTAPVRDKFDHEQLVRLNALVATLANLGNMNWLDNVECTCDLPSSACAWDIAMVENDWFVYAYNACCCCWAKVAPAS